MKKRVHELAKDYGINNKEFMALLNDELQIEVTSHLSSLAEKDIDKIKSYFDNISKQKAEKKEKKDKKGATLKKRFLEEEEMFDEELSLIHI